MANAKEPVAPTPPPGVLAAPKKRETRKRIKSDAEEVLGVRFLSRVDPTEDFSDVDGDPRNSFALDNEANDRHPIWVAAGDIDTYRGHVVPHRIEHYSDDGVKPLMGVERPANGEPITKKGLVLMTCDKAKWQKRNRYEYVQTMRTNAAMVKRRQRDVDLRDREAFEEEFSEVKAEMRS